MNIKGSIFIHVGAAQCVLGVHVGVANLFWYFGEQKCKGICGTAW